MAGGHHKSLAKTNKPIGALHIQTSVYGISVALMYGTNRVPMNLIQYEDFIAIPHTSTQKTGGKGGSKPQSNTTYTYQAAICAALCEGAAGGINGIGKIWLNKEVHTMADLGLTLFNGADTQTAWSYLTGAHPTRADAYPRTAYVANASFALDSSAALPNLTLEVKSLLLYNAGTNNDAEPSAILTDYLTESVHGAGLGAFLGSLTMFRQYCIARGIFISPVESNQRPAAAFVQEVADICNSAPIVSNGLLTLIPYGDTTLTGGGQTYTPNLTPAYALNASDFLRTGDHPPLQHSRKPPQQAYNHVRIEYSDRSYDYNPVIVEVQDQADIDDNGRRSKNIIKYPPICVAAIAQDVAQHMMQRDLFVRDFYTGQLSVQYSRLEPMDLLSITDPDLGLVNQLMRITYVNEVNDALDIEMESMNIGNANAPMYASTAPGGYNQDYNAAPGSVVAPLLMNGPGLLTPTGYETWIAVCGLGAFWGGCNVWVSEDNVEYRLVGNMIAPCRYGTLGTNLATNATASDTTHTINAILNRGQVTSGTATDMNNFRTLLYVGGEWMSYQTAALVSGSTYNISTLQRGAYGSVISGHAIGDPIAVIDEGVFHLPYDRGNVGQQVYFKFTSFNIFGGAAESLASVTAYSRVLGASPITAPVTPTDVAALSIVSGVTTIDCARSTHFKLSLTANTTIRVINAPSKFKMYVEVDQTGAFTYLHPSTITSATGINYSASSGAGQIDFLEYTTFDGGLTWKYTYVKPASTFSLSLAPSPASGTANSVSGANVSPSVVVTATPTNPSGAVTYLWTRTDSGTPTHTISSTTVANPTFSIPSGHTVQSNANTWQCQATDAASNVRTQSVVITLSVTSSGSPPLTQVISPDVSSELKVGHSWAKVMTSTLAGGTGTGQTWAWSYVSGNTNFTLTGGSTTQSPTLNLAFSKAYGIYTAVWQCIGNDSGATPVTTTFNVSVELSNGL